MSMTFLVEDIQKASRYLRRFWDDTNRTSSEIKTAEQIRQAYGDNFYKTRTLDLAKINPDKRSLFYSINNITGGNLPTNIVDSSYLATPVHTKNPSQPSPTKPTDGEEVGYQPSPFQGLDFNKLIGVVVGVMFLKTVFGLFKRG